MTDIAISRPAARATKKRRSALQTMGLVFGLLILTAGAIWMLLPLVWMLSASLLPLSEVIKVPPVWFAPSKYSLGNYVEVWSRIGFSRYFFNSAFIALT